MAISFLMALAVAVGALIPLQSGVNASLGKALGLPVFAALTNFAVGGVALALISWALKLRLPSAALLQQAPWWTYCGGVCGACLVIVAVVAAPRLGAGLLVACLIAGQLLSSVSLDHFGWVGYSQRPISALRVVGLALLAGGVFCIRRG